MRPSKRQKTAFTLIEMLIVVSIFAIVSTVVALLFSRGTSLYRHGETHIEMQRSGRHLTARVTPYITSMFNVNSPTASAMIVPATADPNLESPILRFRTTEDWLNAAYPSTLTSSMMAGSTSDLRSHIYQVQQAPDGNVVLERLEEPTPGTFNVTDTRVLLRKKPNETFSALRFTLVRSSLLVLKFETSKETRGDNNQPVTITEKFRITFNLPTKSV